MDKTPDVRRGASRFSSVKRQIKQSGRKLFSGLDDDGGDAVLTEKSKEERARKLSVVGRASLSYQDCEMGCFGSDGDDDDRQQTVSPSCIDKRFKLPKVFYDCNSVNHTPVPRKLRSAMKKRNCESLSLHSPDSEKLTHTMSGVALFKKKNGSTKKSKMDMKQGSSDISPRWVIPAPITKDEEEVVETLYALAGMFSTIESTDASKLDVELPEVRPSALPEAVEGSKVAFKVPKDIADSPCPSVIAESAYPSSSIERSPRERGTVNDDFLCKPHVPEQSILIDCKQFHPESDSNPQVNLQTIPFRSESEPADKKPLCGFVNFGIPAQQSLEPGLNQPNQQEALLPKREPDIELSSASHFRSRLEHQYSIKEAKKDGLALWPGLSSVHGAEIHGPPPQSSAKYPAWLNTPTCASSPGSSQNSFSTEKVSTAAVDRKSWKRCAAHVHISRLIQVLHNSERRDRLPVQPNQLRPNKGLKQGALMVENNVNGVRNECSRVLSGGIGGSAVEKKANEARNGVLLHKRLHQDQQRAAVPSGTYALQKQSFDFLSLSAGGGGIEANNSNNRANNWLESLSHHPTPYFHSLAQNQTIMPFSFPQNRYSASTFPDHLSTAAAQQISLHLPLYPGNQFCGIPHTNITSSTKRQQQQLQHQRQQQMWAAQLAHRPGITSAAISQFSSWTNGMQDSPSLVPCAYLPPPSSALEVQGPKYMPISSQQQQLRAITSSLPPARVRRHHHQLPSGFEENGGGFRSGRMLPSELLCNEHL